MTSIEIFEGVYRDIVIIILGQGSAASAPSYQYLAIANTPTPRDEPILTHGLGKSVHSIHSHLDFIYSNFNQAAFFLEAFSFLLLLPYLLLLLVDAGSLEISRYNELAVKLRDNTGSSPLSSFTPMCYITYPIPYLLGLPLSFAAIHTAKPTPERCSRWRRSRVGCPVGPAPLLALRLRGLATRPSTAGPPVGM